MTELHHYHMTELCNQRLHNLIGQVIQVQSKLFVYQQLHFI